MYTRLLALGLIDSVLTLPVALTELVVSRLRSGKNGTFWPGWTVAHRNVTTVIPIPTEKWRAEGKWMVVELKFSQWSGPFAALIFFALFGLTEQKRTQYRKLFWKIMKPTGLTPRANVGSSDIWFGSGPVISGAGNTQGMTR